MHISLFRRIYLHNIGWDCLKYKASSNWGSWAVDGHFFEKTDFLNLFLFLRNPKYFLLRNSIFINSKILLRLTAVFATQWSSSGSWTLSWWWRYGAPRGCCAPKHPRRQMTRLKSWVRLRSCHALLYYLTSQKVLFLSCLTKFLGKDWGCECYCKTASAISSASNGPTEVTLLS